MDKVGNGSRTSKAPSSRAERSEPTSKAKAPERVAERPSSSESRSSVARQRAASAEGGSLRSLRRDESTFIAVKSQGSAPSDHARQALQQLQRVEASMGLRTPVDKRVERRLLENALSAAPASMPTDTASLGQYVLREARELLAKHGDAHAPVGLVTLVRDLEKAGSSARKIQEIFDQHGLHIRLPEDLQRGTPASRPTLPRTEEIQRLEVQQAVAGLDFPADRSVRLDYLRDTKGSLRTDVKSVAEYLQQDVELQLARYGANAPPHLSGLREDLGEVIAGKASLEQVLADYAMEDPRP